MGAIIDSDPQSRAIAPRGRSYSRPLVCLSPQERRDVQVTTVVAKIGCFLGRRGDALTAAVAFA